MYYTLVSDNTKLLDNSLSHGYIHEVDQRDKVNKRDKKLVDQPLTMYAMVTQIIVSREETMRDCDRP